MRQSDINKCKICGRTFVKLALHVRAAHKISPKEYHDRYFKVETDGICAICGSPTRFAGFYRGYLKTCSSHCMHLYVARLPSSREAHRISASKTWKGFWESSEWRAAHAERNKDPQRCANHSKFMKNLWENPSYRNLQRVSRAIRPTHLEDEVQKLLDEISPGDFKYVGDFSQWIGGRCPDFICESKRLVVEAFGDVWHAKSDEPFRTNYFKTHGYKCLVIWQSDLYKNRDEVAKRTRMFIEDSLTVIAESDLRKNELGELLETPESSLATAEPVMADAMAIKSREIGQSAAKPTVKAEEGSETSESNLMDNSNGEISTSAQPLSTQGDDIVRACVKAQEAEIKNSAITFRGRDKGIRPKHHQMKGITVVSKLGELLGLRDSCSDHNVTGNGERDGLKTEQYVEISSQASGRPEEGSTTRESSLSPMDMVKSPRAPSSCYKQDDDIVCSALKSVEAMVNS